MRKFLARFRKKSVRSAEERAYAAITAAAAELAEVWGVCNATEAAGHFTCREAEALADLFHAIGYSALAFEFLEGHAYADTDEDDMHHGMYLELTTEPAFA